MFNSDELQFYCKRNTCIS